MAKVRHSVPIYGDFLVHAYANAVLNYTVTICFPYDTCTPWTGSVSQHRNKFWPDPHLICRTKNLPTEQSKGCRTRMQSDSEDRMELSQRPGVSPCPCHRLYNANEVIKLNFWVLTVVLPTLWVHSLKPLA